MTVRTNRHSLNKVRVAKILRKNWDYAWTWCNWFWCIFDYGIKICAIKMAVRCACFVSVTNSMLTMSRSVNFTNWNQIANLTRSKFATKLEFYCAQYEANVNRVQLSPSCIELEAKSLLNPNSIQQNIKRNISIF